MEEIYHIPAMLEQTIDALNIKKDGTYIDATFGGGGHSLEIFKKLTSGRLIAFDQDSDAQKNAWEAKNFMLIKSNFQFIKNYTDYLEIEQVDGILADLGISTHHIDSPERGFSFRFDARLDMRMNTEQELDAFEVVNEYSAEKLNEIFKNYGEINIAKRIASVIVEQRKKKRIETTFDLVETVKSLIPKKVEHKFLAKIFQAIRIEVNQEMETLKKFLVKSVEILKPKGRLVIISYHSLEDKIVKDFFRTGNFDGERITDMYGNVKRMISPVNNKVIIPSDEEIAKNNRVRSAKMRIAEKNE